MPLPSPLGIGLRPAVPEDREFLWLLHCETMRSYVELTWGWDEDWQRRRFDQRFNPPALKIIVKDGAPIGFVHIERTPGTIFLTGIEIAPAEQNRGIASQIIRDLLAEADRERLPVRLQVLKVNPARRLYLRLGFRSAGESTTHYLLTREPD